MSPSLSKKTSTTRAAIQVPALRSFNSVVGVGIVGCGYWGPNLIRNFASTPGARLAAICDLNEQRLGMFVAQHPGAKGFTRYEEMLKRRDVDAVVIATPVASHFELAKKALMAGKHVLVEKPMTATVAESEELIALADRKNLTLMVDHTFAYTAAVRRIRDMVRGGDLGLLHYYDSVRINLGLFRKDVNVLWDLAVHDLSIMDFALGAKPCAVSATGLRHFDGEQEDVAYLTCFFPDKLIAHFHLNWLSPVKIRRTIIGGDRRMCVYDDLEPSEKIKIYDRGADMLTATPEQQHQAKIGYRMGDMWAPNLPPDEALRSESLHFIQCVQTAGTPDTDGHAGLRVMRILEAANQSLALRGAPVEIHHS